MNKFVVFVALISLLCVLGCSRIQSNKLPGTYVFNQSNGRDTLIILANGTYIHTAYRNNKRQLNNGTWKFNGVEIAFNNFTFFDGGNGIWVSKIIQDGNDIKLDYADEEVFYLKLK